MKRRMLAMMLEGGCRQPNEVLAAAKRMLADGEAALKLSLTAGWFAACAAWRLHMHTCSHHTIIVPGSQTHRSTVLHCAMLCVAQA